MPTQPDLQEIKTEARRLLKTAQIPPLRMAALLLAISLGLDLIGSVAANLTNVGSVDVLPVSLSFFDVLIMLISGVLNAGFLLYCLRVRRGETVRYSGLFDAFPFAGKVILLDVLQWLLIGLGLSLFILPGIVMLFSYSLARLHLLDDPEINVLEALRRSRIEMMGHKWQLFLLYISFWPFLLAESLAFVFCQTTLARALPDTLAGEAFFILASGLLLACVELFLTPYLRLSQAGFFERVRGDAVTPEQPLPPL